MTKEEIISLIRVDRNGEPWYTIKEVKDAMQQYADQECAAKDKRIKDLENALAPLAELDLAGVTSGILYQRNSSKIFAADVRLAKQLLTPKN